MPSAKAPAIAGMLFIGIGALGLQSNAYAEADAATATASDAAAAKATAEAKKAADEKEKADKAKAAAAAAAAAAPIEQIIVTGSRIRHDQFTSDSPIQIITKDQSVLAGLTTTTETLQGSTVSGGSNQINNYFGGYVTDGGPGANTLSLRGLGAVRTLVLLNGRRLAPSGTRGSVGSADLNVLPSAMVDRIEILKDGASSIYGSDAVAGVVNIITKKGIRDWTVEGSLVGTSDGGGTQTDLSLVGGHTWDRFEVSGSVEFYNRTNLAIGQRDWASCPSTASIIDAATQQPKCFPISGLTGTNGIARDYVVAPLYDTNFDVFGARWTPDPSAGGLIPGWREVSAAADRPSFDRRMLNDSLISPTRNVLGFLNGSYDLHALGNGEAYFEILYARRESNQIGSRQISLDYQYSFDPTNPNSNFFGDVPHPFVPQAFSSDPNYATYVGSNPFGDDIQMRALVFWGNDNSRQVADFTRAVVGLRGDLPFSDWRYDANVTMAHSQASYTFEAAYQDRVYDSLYVTPVSGSTSLPSRTVNGVTYVCASGNPACVPAPIVTADFLNGDIDQAYRSYIWGDHTGHTTYDEATFAANIDGRLFRVPAGDVRGALGIEARTLKLDDEPSPDAIAGNLYAFTQSGVTKGKDAVREAFGEIEVPLLRGKSLAESLSLNLSGRYTDYNSYGSDETYKAGIAYTPVKWLKLRGTKGSSYRAPALFEQYLSPTSGFLQSNTDPCYDYGNTLPPTSRIYINCASEGLPPNWGANSGVQVNSAGGAALGIKSEKSHADTLGIVIQPSLPARAGDLAFAIDWWRINVGNQVAQIGAGNLLQLCYDDPQFRAGGSYCAYSHRDANGNLTVNDYYLNIATQVAEGVDYNVRYSREIGVGELIADLRATHYIAQNNRLLPTDPLDHLNGTLLNPSWVGDADIRYKRKAITLRYGMTYIHSMDSNAYLGFDSTAGYNVGRYITHDVSMKYEGENKLDVIFGIRNLTDVTPKTIEAGEYDRVGNSLLYSGYDYFGRRVFLTVSRTL
ncbi:MAG TPA: TonB-dependent receptor [Burkholderiaceae bacterium]|nr:TonB-dependent receptor [Burkholderiaceae bacterium]